MSFDQYNKVLSKNRIERGTARAQQLQRVGLRLKAAVERYLSGQGQSDIIRDYRWDFNLINDQQINAWCMPGGKVAFYTGILPVCKDETGIAVVMGHEIAHALANHGAERMSQQQLVQFGGILGKYRAWQLSVGRSFSADVPYSGWPDYIELFTITRV